MIEEIIEGTAAFFKLGLKAASIPAPLLPTRQKSVSRASLKSAVESTHDLLRAVHATMKVSINTAPDIWRGIVAECSLPNSSIHAYSYTFSLPLSPARL